MAIVCLFVHWNDYFLHHIIRKLFLIDSFQLCGLLANNSETSIPEGVCSNLRKTPKRLQLNFPVRGGGTLNVEVIGMLVENFFWKTLKNTQILILNL